MIQQVFCHAAAVIIVVAYQYNQAGDVMLQHEFLQIDISKVEGARRIPGTKTLWITSINQSDIAIFLVGVSLLNVDRFKLFYTIDYFIIKI